MVGLIEELDTDALEDEVPEADPVHDGEPILKNAVVLHQRSAGISKRRIYHAGRSYMGHIAICDTTKAGSCDRNT